MSRSINICNGEVPLILILRGRYWKNNGGKVGQHCELKLSLLVTGENIFVFNGFRCSCCIEEDLEFWISPLYEDIPTPWSSYWLPHSLFIEIKAMIFCSHSRCCCVGVFHQLCRHNIIIKLSHNFIDDSTFSTVSILCSFLTSVNELT